MHKFAGVVLTLVLACSSLPVAAQAPSASDGDSRPPAELGKAFSVTYGQAIALYLQASMPVFIKLSTDWEAPVVVTYNANTQKLAFVIFGGRTTIDSAKASVDKFRRKVLGPALDVAGAAHGVTLTEEQTSIIYVNKASEKKLLTFDGTNYTL